MITLNLSPDAEAWLREQARVRRISVSCVVEELVADARAKPNTAQLRRLDELRAAMDAWK